MPMYEAPLLRPSYLFYMNDYANRFKPYWRWNPNVSIEVDKSKDGAG